MQRAFKIPEETSTFLDIVRAIAALTVFISHFTSQKFSGGFFWFLQPLGTRAVDVFFVLSGFLIANSVANHNNTLRSYAIARMSRIYSVVVPAMLFTLISYELILYLNNPHDSVVEVSWGTMASSMALNLVFLGQLWNSDVHFLSDTPLWSLNFEVIYYAIFGMQLIRGPWRYIGTIGLLLLAGPKIVVMLPIWLLGVLTERIAARDAISSRQGVAMCVLATVIFLIWWRLGIITHDGPFVALDTTPKRLLAITDSYATGALFAAFVLGFHAARQKCANAMRHLAAPARWLAGISFAFYLFHLPLMDAIEALVPWPVATWQTRLTVLVLVPLLIWPLAMISERRKGAWARLFNRALPGRPLTTPTAPSP